MTTPRQREDLWMVQVRYFLDRFMQSPTPANRTSTLDAILTQFAESVEGGAVRPPTITR